MMNQAASADTITTLDQNSLEESTESVAEPRGEKRPTESAEFLEQPIDKRPRASPPLDLSEPFTIQPKMKGSVVPSGASAVKDPAVAPSVASAISLPLDRAMFRAEPDVVSVALAAQSAILAAERIAEIGRRLYDAVELIGSLKVEVEAEKKKAKSATADLAIATKRAEAEAKKAEEERAKAIAEEEKTKHADLLRRAAEEKAKTTEIALAKATQEIEKLKADLQEAKVAKEKAESEASKAFDAGETAAMEKYADEALKFENRGFKHGWLKALAAVKVTLDMPIPYEQLEVEPLESDPEEL